VFRVRGGLSLQQLCSWGRGVRRAAEFDAILFTPLLASEEKDLRSLLAPKSVAAPYDQVDIYGASVWIWRTAPAGGVTAFTTLEAARIGPTCAVHDMVATKLVRLPRGG